jgi:hypothetical protein
VLHQLRGSNGSTEQHAPGDDPAEHPQARAARRTELGADHRLFEASESGFDIVVDGRVVARDLEVAAQRVGECRII